MSTIDYLLVGHIASDIVADGGSVLGGTVSYSAPIASALGQRVGIVSSAKVDEPVLNSLSEHVERYIIPSEHTTTYENIQKPTGRKQYVRAVAQPITAESIPADWRSQVKRVHLAPIADEVDVHIIQALPWAKVLLTPQGWMRQWDETGRVHFKAWLDEQALSKADMVIISEEDIQTVPQIEMDYARYAKILVVTQGDQGGRYYVNGVRHVYDAVQTTVVDTTGAGDVFATACFIAWDMIGDMGKAVQIGAQIAAWSITQVGICSSPQQTDELQRLIKRLGL
jgi:sugar/nucleoside kinase (ribokinase family)